MARSSSWELLNDPALSLRCKELLQDRNDKVKLKQKTKYLLKRSRGIAENAPANKKSVIKKMNTAAADLERRIQIFDLQIEKSEENIVRRGCPGLIL